MSIKPSEEGLKYKKTNRHSASEWSDDESGDFRLRSVIGLERNFRPLPKNEGYQVYGIVPYFQSNYTREVERIKTVRVEELHNVCVDI